MQVRVMEGKRIILRDKVQTDIDGKLDVNFFLPEKADAKHIAIVAEDLAKDENSPKDIPALKITVPIPVNRPENTDLQFMPEGGNLVAGLSNRVAFKAVSEDGKGFDVSGKIYSNAALQDNSLEVATFTSTHLGMGSFEFLPKAGETYSARITLADGTIKTYPLPAVKTSGTVLRVTDLKESDSLVVSVSVSPDLQFPAKPAPLSYYLLGQYGGVICYAAILRSNTKVRIAKRLFPSGIVHFTLINSDKQPLNERIVYVDHNDNLKITVQPDKSSYSTRDSIALNILVNNKEGKPVRGSFSLAVTDDSQVNLQTLNSSIISSLLLTSDLKGSVEDPEYYFRDVNDSTARDLDNLLLTQGWVGYNWQKIFNPEPAPEYKAEPDFTVRGKITNIFDKALNGTKVVLVSVKPLFFMDTVTNSKGEFIFGHFPSIDSAVFKLQASNRKGKQFNVGIEAEEFKPPVFTGEQRFMPWYVNSDTSLLNYVNSTITRHEEEMKFSGNGNLLKEVIITAKKTVKGSKNLNGIGNADITLDQTDVLKAGKLNLLQLIHKRIPSFSERVTIDRRRFFTLNGFELKVVIDGMDLDFYYTPGSGGRGADDPSDHYWYVRDYLEYFSAEDVKGLELMKYGKNSFKYTNEFYDGPPIPAPQYAWLEITTRAGKGPFMRNTPGTYLFKAMPFVGTREFYSPGYALKNDTSKLPDLRSTIYWHPDIITNAEGKATVSFYSADKPGTYTILTEGSDMNGGIGTGKDKIIIKP
jgi:hypothetical protein